MTDPTPVTPVQISESPVPASIMMFVRQMTLALSFLAAVGGFVAKHDLAAAVAWLQTADGASETAGAIFLATVVFGQLSTLRLRAMLVRVIREPAKAGDMVKFK